MIVKYIIYTMYAIAYLKGHGGTPKKGWRSFFVLWYEKILRHIKWKKKQGQINVYTICMEEE